MISIDKYRKDIIRYEKSGNGIVEPAIPVGIAAVSFLVFRLICNFLDYIKDEGDNWILDHLSIIDDVDDKVTISNEARWKYMKLYG